jgi:DNA-directed RNA polymerase
MTNIDAQIERERQMKERGKARLKAQIDKALARGDAAETPAGVALARRAIAPLAEAIKAFKVTAFTGKAGRRSTAAKMLDGVDEELAAFVAIRMALAGSIRGYGLSSTARSLASRLEMEIIADAFEEENSALYRAVIRNATSRGLSTSRQAKAVELANTHFGVVKAPRWTTAEKINLGAKLLELVIETTGLLEVTNVKLGRNHTNLQLRLKGGIEEWFKSFNRAATLTKPLYLPTLLPPQPWSTTDAGPYYSPLIRAMSVVTKPFPGQVEALDAADLSTVYAGLNALQETPWRINHRVYEVMKEAWERDLPLGCLPPRDPEVLPEAPEEVVNDVKGGEHRKAWRSQMRAIHERNAAGLSNRFEFNRALSIAEENLEQPAIYFPHRLDFRGRAYAAATTLNPQGSDEVRGLLEFAEGKPLGSRGVFWLGVHGANLFGNDKVSLEEREDWAFKHTVQARQVAEDPLWNLWWTEADKPWSFLAWCFEWAEMYYGEGHANPAGYVSHLPIALDGSCNGIQHFSAMLRDEVGGAAVNLVPSDKPQDIYGRVAERTIERLRHHAELADENAWVAAGWLSYGIDRKTTKRAVMVLPYGGTFKSCVEYVRASVRERLNAGAENPFGDHLPKAEAFLASLVWASIGDVVIAAREAMSWLQAVARVATAAGQGLRWTTPSGFVVTQHYRELANNRIKTKFCGSIVVFQTLDEGDKIDAPKQASAIAPNFVHSLDASAMMLTLSEGRAQGIKSWAMIHDSYGTHAADTDALANILRMAFVKMYEEHDVLTEFRDAVAATLTPEQAAKLPPVPKSGKLDLSAVLEAEYFFA